MKRENEAISHNIMNAISPYDEYCEGYGNTGSTGNSYFLGTVLAIGKDTRKFSHAGSTILDEINVFDIAETEQAYLGQINMSIVSSFCGPQGVIWGLDVCRSQDLFIEKNKIGEVELGEKKIDTFSILPLVTATKKLFGTVSDKRFILKPGAHVPCASKNIKIKGPGIVYAGIGIGIPRDREKNACLLMEDFGLITPDKDPDSFINEIERNIAKSIIQIGINQKVEYEIALVGAKYVLANEDEFACALIASPYFTIAKNAIPDKNPAKLLDLSIDEWEELLISHK